MGIAKPPNKQLPLLCRDISGIWTHMHVAPTKTQKERCNAKQTARFIIALINCIYKCK